MAAARRRSAADKATKEAFDQLAQAATGSAPTPEEVEHLKQATDTTPPKTLTFQVASLDKALHRISESLIEQLKPIGEFSANVSERMKPIIDTTNKIFELFENAQSVINRFLEENGESLQIWGTLAPYMSKEADEHPEKYGDNATEPATVEDLVKAAAARARADGKFVPMLKIEEIDSEQLEFVIDTPASDESSEIDSKEMARREAIRNTFARRAEVKKESTTAFLEKVRLALISDKTLGVKYFTTEVIKTIQGGIEKEITDEHGKIKIFDLTEKREKPLDSILSEADNLQVGFLYLLLHYVAEAAIDIRELNKESTLLISIPLIQFFQETRIDPRPRLRDGEGHVSRKEISTGETMATLRYKWFMNNFITPLESLAGYYGEDLYRLLAFNNYEAETETIYITAPYFIKLRQYAELHAGKHAAIAHIFEANVITEPQAAIELANRIAMGLLERGILRKDKQSDRLFTWHRRFDKIIKECPLLQTAIDTVRTTTGPLEREARALNKDEKEILAARKADHKTDPQRINRKMADTFNVAISIIMKKSTIPLYYSNLKIRSGNYATFKPPTNSTLRDELIITHEGKDPNYHGK